MTQVTKYLDLIKTELTVFHLTSHPIINEKALQEIVNSEIEANALGFTLLRDRANRGLRAKFRDYTQIISLMKEHDIWNDEKERVIPDIQILVSEVEGMEPMEYYHLVISDKYVDSPNTMCGKKIDNVTMHVGDRLPDLKTLYCERCLNKAKETPLWLLKGYNRARTTTKKTK